MLLHALIKRGFLWYITFSLVIILLPIPSLGNDEKTKHVPPIASYKDIQLIGNALSILQFISMDSKNSKKFVYSALEAMAEALDRYSFFVPPELIDIFFESRKDNHVGIGILIAKTENGNLEIIAVDPNSPAFKAGMKPKDVIITIDGKATNKMRLVDALRLVSNPSLSIGSKATLTILRKDNKTPRDFVITRELIKPQTIEGEIIEKNYGFIKLKKFTKSTLPNIKKTITDMELKAGTLKGLIIDLRNNPGGEIDSSVELSKLFIESGVIASLDSNLPSSKVIFKADKENTYKWSLVIIVDEGSASASELFSGALQYHKRAKIIGKKTFGKGTFQSFIPISDESGLYITLGKFYMPDGSSVEGKGLTPDVIIEKDTNEANTIKKALEILKNNP